jgi:hypothetical protein
MVVGLSILKSAFLVAFGITVLVMWNNGSNGGG